MKSLLHYYLACSVILKNLIFIRFLFLGCYLLFLFKFLWLIFLICILKFLCGVFRCGFSLSPFFVTLPGFFFLSDRFAAFQSRKYISTIQIFSSFYLCLSLFLGFLFNLNVSSLNSIPISHSFSLIFSISHSLFWEISSIWSSKSQVSLLVEFLLLLSFVFI